MGDEGAQLETCHSAPEKTINVFEGIGDIVTII
jgi:hypothetical protein